jgi:hypothetical protein
LINPLQSGGNCCCPPNCNVFSCPLPSDADKCQCGSSHWGTAGVRCHDSCSSCCCN